MRLVFKLNVQGEQVLELENVCIESTMDYERFKPMVGNRTIIEANVKKLVASMSDSQLASIAIVNGKDEIIDGQHRYKACKELNLPFYFIVMKHYGINEVHILNSNTKNWSNYDFVHQFAERYANNEKIFIHYFRLSEFMKIHHLQLNNALLLLEGGVKSGTIPLRNGTFKITADKEIAEENLTELIELEKLLGSSITSQAFWQTYILSKQVNKFDSNRFFNKIKKVKTELDDTKDSFKYLINVFEEAYNSGRNPDLNLAFSAKQIEKQLKRNKTEEVDYDD